MKKAFKNLIQKKHFLVLVGLILVGVLIFTFQKVEISEAKPDPPNPGHGWSQMECDTNLCVDTVGGAVGIGTLTPTAPLEVMGEIRFGDGNGYGKLLAGSTFVVFANQLGTWAMTISQTTGNVGIGTGAYEPSQTLSVGGTLGIVSGSYSTVFQGGIQSADIIYTLPTALPGTGLTGLLTSSDSGTLSWTDQSTDFLSQYALLAGRSGGQTLYGGIDANDTLIFEGTSNETKGNIFLNSAGGSVGIGTNSLANLEVAVPTFYVTSGSSPLNTILSNSVTTQENSDVQFDFLHAQSSGNYGTSTARISAIKLDSYTYGNGYTIDGGLAFYTVNDNSLTEKMRLDNLGRLIPTMSASYDLGSSDYKWNTLYGIAAILDEVRLGGYLVIKETGDSPQYYSFFQGGDQSADIIYTLPTALPGTGLTGLLTSNDSGILSWTDESQYALLAGRAGGQDLYGGTATGDNLRLFASSGTGDGGGGSIGLVAQNGQGLGTYNGGDVGIASGSGSGNDSGNGGNGGELQFYTGPGGQASESYNAGAGGDLSIILGNGGQANLGASGRGGNFSLSAGNGAEGNGDGGSGGAVVLTAGNGAYSPIGQAGAGGELGLAAGNGGPGGGETGIAGPGGNVQILAGNGASGSTPSAGGNVTIAAGNRGGEGADYGQIILNGRGIIKPEIDNADDLGSGDYRFKDLKLAGSANIDTSLKIKETGDTTTYYTTFEGGDQSADIIYTLPTALPGSGTTGFLKSDEYGTLSWESGSRFTGDISVKGGDNNNCTMSFAGGVLTGTDCPPP